MPRQRTEPRTELGRQLARRIDELGLTMEQAAKELHTTDQTVRDWFRGSEPTTGSIKRIAKFCGVSPVTVFGWVDSSIEPNPGYVRRFRDAVVNPTTMGFRPGLATT